MKTISDTKALAQNQMMEVFDYELKSFFVDLPDASPEELTTDPSVLFGAMMLSFENKERIKELIEGMKWKIITTGEAQDQNLLLDELLEEI